MTELQAPGDHGAQLRPRDGTAVAGGGAEALAADGCRPTWSARRSCRPTARRTRPTSRRRLPRARAWAACDRRGLPGHGDPDRKGPRRRRRAPRRATSAARSWSIAAGNGREEIGALAGVTVPLQSVQHQYLVTEPIAGVPRNLPTLRDPDRLIYFKEEVGGLVMGGYEPNPIAWAVTASAAGLSLPAARHELGSFRADDGAGAGARAGAGDRRRQAAHQRPGILHARRQFHSRRGAGAEELLRRRRLQRLRHRLGAAARARRSPNGSPAASRRWISGRWISAASAACTATAMGLRTRTLEAYGKHYTMAWPHEEYDSGRPLRVSPLYERLKDQGAVFGSKLGWERPNWFAPQGVEPNDIYSFGRQNWFEYVGGEHRACRETSALFDQTSFAKFMLVGKDAEAALSLDLRQRRRADAGSLIYTQMLNRARRHRMRSDRVAARRRRLLHRHRHRLRDARFLLDRSAHPRGTGCAADRCHLRLRRAVADGPAGARRAPAGHR